VTQKKLSSSAFYWDLHWERFQYRRHIWKVDEAKQIIRDKPRPVFQINIQQFKDLLRQVCIDWDKAASDATNLDVPIIMAYGRHVPMPIDGWHRIGKALLKGIDTLPATKLTKDESKRVYFYLGPRRRRRRG